MILLLIRFLLCFGFVGNVFADNNPTNCISPAPASSNSTGSSSTSGGSSSAVKVVQADTYVPVGVSNAVQQSTAAGVIGSGGTGGGSSGGTSGGTGTTAPDPTNAVAWVCPAVNAGTDTAANWSIGHSKTHDYQVACEDSSGHQFPAVSYYVHCMENDIDVSMISTATSGSNVFTNMTITNFATANSSFYIESIKCTMLYDQLLEYGWTMAPEISNANCSGASDWVVWGGVTEQQLKESFQDLHYTGEEIDKIYNGLATNQQLQDIANALKNIVPQAQQAKQSSQAATQTVASDEGIAPSTAEQETTSDTAPDNETITYSAVGVNDSGDYPIYICCQDSSLAGGLVWKKENENATNTCYPSPTSQACTAATLKSNGTETLPVYYFLDKLKLGQVTADGHPLGYAKYQSYVPFPYAGIVAKGNYFWPGCMSLANSSTINANQIICMKDRKLLTGAATEKSAAD